VFVTAEITQPLRGLVGEVRRYSKMTTGLKVSCAGLAALILMALPAAAKVCKDESITATSRDYVSRSLGAFPGSWAAWRKEVSARLGNGWQAWRRAEDRTIKCEQAENSAGRKRWSCTRTARPCRPGSAGVVEPPKPPVVWVPIDRILERGMRVRPRDRQLVKEQIRTLQYLLNEAGFEVEIDGVFGGGTQSALINFQKKNDLDVDGKAGPKTVEALTS